MAQYVDYWSDNVTFLEGPFVVCGGPLPGSVGRIECSSPHRPCPVMVDQSIYALLDAERPDWKKDKGAAVDWLNALVREGRITLQDVGQERRTWIAHGKPSTNQEGAPTSSEAPKKD